MTPERMKEVFIISTGQIFKGRTAGSQRMMNIAKSLAAGNITVFLASLYNINHHIPDSIEVYPGIFNLRSSPPDNTGKLHLFGFIRTLHKFITARNSEAVLYLYPTVFIFKDFIYLVYFKLIKRYKLFCDINELRTTNVFSSPAPKELTSRIKFWMKSVLDLTAYKISEVQVLFYNGVVVISTNLEKYFSHRAKRMIRVPVLCDTTKASVEKNANSYDYSVFRICFAGYINSKKEGFDLLFEALSRINLTINVELYLYGILTDTEKPQLYRLIERFSLEDKVFYMGNIDPDDLAVEFKKYHLLILSRPLVPQTRYGFSTKLSEYLISGVPVLVTDVSDNSFYIKDNYNGFIIPPGSLKHLEEKIIEIIEKYNTTADSIVKNALRTAEENFDFKLYTMMLIKFFFPN